MPLPTLAKTWTFSNNNRISFVSLNDTMARFLFGIKDFLKTTMGYTVAGSSNGTTGGTAGTPDGVDRWATFSNATTRGAAAGNAQSWVILTDGNGVQILLTYQGATDDVARIAYSPGALYVVAATTQNQPTATDEIVLVSATTVINATASLDRVWHIQASTDKKLFRTTIYRNSTHLYTIGVELVTRDPNMLASFIWSPVVVGWATNTSSLTSNGGPFGSPATNQQAQARISGLTPNLGGVGESLGWAVVTVPQPELQAFTPIVNIGLYSNLSNLQGRLADRIDLWASPVGGQLGQGDTFGSLQFAYLGAYVFPWDGSTTPVIA